MNFARAVRKFWNSSAGRMLSRGLGYEGGAGGRRWRYASELVSPPAAALASRASIMRRARGAYSNQAIARAIIEAWVSSLVGTGIKPNSKAENADAINAAFSAWWDRCDYDQLTDFGGLQAALARSMVMTGDGICAFETSPAGELRLRLIASEQVATVSSDLSGGRWIVDGVEYDADMRRQALHLFRNPPGLPLPNPSLETVRLAAEDCVHLFKQEHVGMVRGISWLAPVLLRLNDLDQTNDALVVRAKTAAMFCGFLTDTDGSILAEDSRGEASMEPGSMVRLKPGEDVKFAEPPQLGAETPPFLKSILREICAGAGVPYETVSGDLSDANYSSLRGAQLNFRARVEQVQYGVIIPQLRKIWRRWLTLEILSGRIDAPGFENDPESWLAADWLCPKWAQVDPVKDTQATLAEIAGGLKSRREAVAERGRDLEDLDSEIAKDNAAAQALGLAFNSSPAPSPQSQEPPQ